MVTESQKHRASLFQILGLILMTPFGRLILRFFNFEPLPVNFHLFIAVIFSLILLYLGIIVVVRSIEILEEGMK